MGNETISAVEISPKRIEIGKIELAEEFVFFDKAFADSLSKSVEWDGVSEAPISMKFALDCAWDSVRSARNDRQLQLHRVELESSENKWYYKFFFIGHMEWPLGVTWSKEEWLVYVFMHVNGDSYSPQPLGPFLRKMGLDELKPTENDLSKERMISIPIAPRALPSL